MQRRHDYAFHLEDGGSVSINGIFHDRLPLLHAFLAVLLQVCVSLLECSKVHLLTLSNQRIVLLHTSNKMNSSSDIAGSGCSAPTIHQPKMDSSCDNHAIKCLSGGAAGLVHHLPKI